MHRNQKAISPKRQGGLGSKTSALLTEEINCSEPTFFGGFILTKRVCLKVILIKQLAPKPFNS